MENGSVMASTKYGLCRIFLKVVPQNLSDTSDVFDEEIDKCVAFFVKLLTSIDFEEVEAHNPAFRIMPVFVMLSKTKRKADPQNLSQTV